MAKQAKATEKPTTKTPHKKSSSWQKQADPARKFSTDYLKQLRAEHPGRRPTREENQQQIRDAEEETAQMKAAIDGAKARLKRRKQEIDEWKLWYTGYQPYTGMAQIDQSVEWARLEAEIAWRAEGINALRVTINKLYEKHFAAKTRLAIARQRLLWMSKAFGQAVGRRSAFHRPGGSAGIGNKKN